MMRFKRCAKESEPAIRQPFGTPAAYMLLLRNPAHCGSSSTPATLMTSLSVSKLGRMATDADVVLICRRDM